MWLEFKGTLEEFRVFKKRYPELKKFVDYIGDGIQHNKEYALVERQLRQDIKDMRGIRDKFIHVMDKAVNKLSED